MVWQELPLNMCRDKYYNQKTDEAVKADTSTDTSNQVKDISHTTDDQQSDIAPDNWNQLLQTASKDQWKQE